MNTQDQQTYPETYKLSQANDDIQVIQDFLEHKEWEGFRLVDMSGDDVPIEDPQDIVRQYFHINLVALEAERKNIVELIRLQTPKPSDG